MDVTETKDLLRFIADGRDRWFMGFTPEEASMMLTGWSDLLADVPLEFAQDEVRRHYKAPDARSIQPGDLVGAWVAVVSRERVEQEQRERAEERAEREAAYRADPPKAIGEVPFSRLGQNQMPPWFREFYTECERVRHEVLAAGGTPAEAQAAVDALPAPQVTQEPTEWERRGRRCRHWKNCACDHRACRDGWLDSEQAMIVPHDPGHTGTVACPHCHDAAIMAAELAPKKSKGRWVR